MSQKTLTKTALNKIKKEAKRIKGVYAITHSQALEIVAKQEGFESYWAAKKCHKASINNSTTPSPKSEILNKALILMDSIFKVPVFGEEVLGKLESITIENTKDLHIDIFKNGISELTKTYGNLFSVLGYSFDRESVKQVGYELLREDDSEKKLMGLLYIALSHFYRSAQNSTTHVDVKHPNFEGYLTDWLRSIPLHDNQLSSASLLSGIFPDSKNPKMINGSTYWPN